MEALRFYKIRYTWSDGRVEESKKQYSDAVAAGLDGRNKLKYSALAAAALSEIEEDPLYIKEYEVVPV